MKEWKQYPACLPQWDEALLARCNQRTAAFGLVLSPRDMEDLLTQARQVLLDTGRMEFGPGCLEKLAAAFGASPYLHQGDYAGTLGELQEIFYHWKNACRDRAGDDEVIAAMAAVYEQRARGSTDYLAGMDREEIWQVIRTRQCQEEEAWDG